MCLPDKITLVLAPLSQNSHRYQLARGKQGRCQPGLHGRQVELVCECVCVRFPWLCTCLQVLIKKQTRENKDHVRNKSCKATQVTADQQNGLRVSTQGHM